MNHEAIQEEIGGEIPYEDKLRQRIISRLTKEPGISKAVLQNRLGFVLTPVFEIVFERLMEEGIVQHVPTRLGLKVAEGQ